MGIKSGVMVAILATACGQSETPGDEDGGVDGDRPGGDARPGGHEGDSYQSGTRIKAEYLVTPDGARSFNGFFDSQRNEPCSMLKSTDGVTRCLPTGTLDVSDLYFADAACTVHASILVTSCLAVLPKYIRIYSFSGCEYRSRIFERGPQIQSYYVNAGGVCQAQPVSPNIAAFSVGAQVPFASFQSTTVVRE
jgi:hypothetical protein